MKQDTRSKILAAAKTLFNEKGFNDVSMNDIASEIGISKGNLTYHFKKKEDIIEEIISMSRPKILPPPLDLFELDTFLRDMQRAVEDNAFYFWHHTQLSQLSSGILEKQRNMYEINMETLKRSLSVLNEKGFIRDQEFESEYGTAADGLLISCIYWMPFSRLRQDTDEKGFREHAWNLMHPLLTESGKKILNDMRPTFLNN